MNYIEIRETIFFGKQNIPWNDVERYIRRYDGRVIRNINYGDEIQINAATADEYVHSQYTRKLRGALAKVKANAAQVIPQLLESCNNRRWIANKDNKHEKDAIRGWYRYDTYFSIKVASNEEGVRFNRYSATIVVKINDTGMYLYDIINIKKEARKPTDS
jgi:hypothetical protein